MVFSWYGCGMGTLWSPDELWVVWREIEMLEQARILQDVFLY
jgi:hypothetical protein